MLAYSKLLDTYFYKKAKIFKRFDSPENAKKYLKSFTQFDFTFKDSGSFMMTVATFNLPNWVYVKLLNTLDIRHRINDFIEMRLEVEHKIDETNKTYSIYYTSIYIGGERFNQCKYLLFNLDTRDQATMSAQKHVNSMDEAIETLSKEAEGWESKAKIPPITEFWGHCSNIE